MKNILYHNPSDAEKIDFERFSKTLNKYAQVPEAEI